MTAAAHNNRLAAETSPYLLQHQHNPVDWYPWGDEAFEASRKRDMPIFLSVGYSTCYWCHVMERQCFENADVAREMNDRFINIKVDREERPDVDQLYMNAVQVLTRHGGWPMSVFLTPDLRPFYGGTYFPPADMHGRPGFVTVLRGIEDAYKNRGQDVEATAQQLANILRDLSEPQPPESPMTIDQRYVDALIDRSTSDYEPTYGGFGTAPKFPRETLLELLLTYTAGGAPSVDPQSQIANRKSQILRMVRHALDAMMYGGIRDQIGGGFHRYSTDAKWLVPHFEIMLYDNAMLAWIYAEAYRQTEDRRYARVAREVLDFVAREMTSPEGAFYTALDAEVDHQEGLNYLWTRPEIEQILGAEDARVFNRAYGVDRGANFADPHHAPPGGSPDKSILYAPEPALLEENYEQLRPMRDKLKAARDKRKQPLLDTKILTSWNALMIRAFAYAGQVLGEPAYVERAERAAGYLLSWHRSAADGTLIRTRPERPITGFLDDYAFLIQALLAIDAAGGNERWRERADELAVLMRAQFEDESRGGFYFTGRDAMDLLVRQKTASDSPLPSGNAVAAITALEMDKPDVARRVIEVFASQLERGAEGMSSIVQAAYQYVKRHGPIEVAAGAQTRSRTTRAEETASDVVSITPSWARPNELHLRLDIKPPFHIQSHEPGPGLLPTGIAIAGIESARIAAVQYPSGTNKTFPFADAPVSVYQGGETVIIHFDREPTERRMQIRVIYQACDESACLPKVTKQFDLAMQ